MTSTTTAPPRVRALALVLVGLAGLLGACAAGAGDPAVREVLVDGGSESLVSTAGVSLRARPGDVVRITNANRGPEGRDAAERGAAGTVVHAFTAAAGDGPGPADIPPLFAEGAGGVVPNAGVWGSCRGGRLADATAGCPVPPIEGPDGWDGRTYWSTGAMLPTESRDIPLAEDIPEGTHRLVCALHPDLVVDVVVGEDAGDPAEPDPAPPPAPLEAVVPAEPDPAVVLVAPAAASTTLVGFWPATVEVAVGDTVTWIAEGAAPHDVVLGATERPDLQHSEPGDALPALPDGPWDGLEEIHSGYLSSDPSAPGGDRLAVTFGAPGTYEYVCRFHPRMTGTVVVR